MGILLIIFVVGLWVFFLIAFLRGRREKEEGTWLEKWILPAGRILDLVLSKGEKGHDRRSDTEEIHQLLRSLMGREEGEKRYQRYRAKRWGSTLFSITLVLSAFLISQAALFAEDASLEMQIQRPDYGEGDRSARVEILVEGEEDSARKEFYLKVPEKEISDGQAQVGLDQAEEILRKNLEGIPFQAEVPLPTVLSTQMGEVNILYRTMESRKIRSNGQILLEVSEEPQTAAMAATLSIGGYLREIELALTLQKTEQATIRDSLEETIRDIEKGRYTDEGYLILPENTEAGETIYWQYAKEDNRFLWLLLMVLVPALVVAKQDSDYKQLSGKRLAQIRSAFPEFIGELAILMGAGASLSGAWIRLGQDYKKQKDKDRPSSMLLDEVEKTAREMEEGVSIREALLHFAERIPVKEVRRFVSLLSQNLRRGDAYLLNRLREMADDAWETRKKLARERSEEVDTKLMLPLMMLLVVVLIIVLSPALISMKF